MLRHVTKTLLQARSELGGRTACCKNRVLINVNHRTHQAVYHVFG